METAIVQISLQAANILIPIIGAMVDNSSAPATVKLAVDAVVHWAPIIATAFPQLAARFIAFIDILRGNAMISDEDLAALDTTQTFLEDQRKAANDAAAAEGE